MFTSAEWIYTRIHMSISLTLILSSTIYYQDIVLARETGPPMKSNFLKIACYKWTKEWVLLLLSKKRS